MNRAALKTAWAASSVRPACIDECVPMPSTVTSRPSWLTVPCASSTLMSSWRIARTAPSSIVTMPRLTSPQRHHGSSTNAGESAAMRKMPAFTIAAAWRKAETGVGAAMAPGSQYWNGTIADLDSAPTTMSAAAHAAAAVCGGSASVAASEKVPVCDSSSMMPTSIDRPPTVVTMSAVWAARRLLAERWFRPTSR